MGWPTLVAQGYLQIHPCQGLVGRKVKAAKAADHNAKAPLDMTNISVILDNEFFAAYNNKYHKKHEWAHKVYWEAVEGMISHGEPGFSVDIGTMRVRTSATHAARLPLVTTLMFVAWATSTCPESRIRRRWL